MADRQNDSLEKRLNKHPHLKNRIEQLLKIVEDAEGDLEKADEAERRVIEELRKMGNEVLHDWAVNKERKGAKAATQKGLIKNGKKK
jgi:hypothetical protein